MEINNNENIYDKKYVVKELVEILDELIKRKEQEETDV